jgi:C-methyltransferase C-terminal domain/Putative zinc binding domain/Methyltransferase domain
MNCRHCRAPLHHVFLDLGYAPPSNAYLTKEALARPETTYPLRLRVCDACWLVQTEDYAGADALFDADYAYFSSTSKTWLDHAHRYFEMARKRFKLGASSFVVEVASNDGYLLRDFVEAGIPCLGIEPTDSTASAAEAANVPVLREFFGSRLAQRLVQQQRRADLVIGNNVLAHVPNINDFAMGLACILEPHGTLTLEFPHILKMMEGMQFDTVYHEHYSYLSLYTVTRVLSQAGLRVFDIDELATHGGSLRVYACHRDDPRPDTPAPARVVEAEHVAGLRSLGTYHAFQGRAEAIKDDLLTFLIAQKRQGRSVAGYGAAAKGNTLLNFAGARPDLIGYVCDAASAKQGKYMPGSHIPILPPSALRERRPDTVMILPWNIANEVEQQHAYIHDWGGRFATAFPTVGYRDV